MKLTKDYIPLSKTSLCIMTVVIPFDKLRVCDSCGCVYSIKSTIKCPACSSENNSRLEDPSKS